MQMWRVIGIVIAVVLIGSCATRKTAPAYSEAVSEIIAFQQKLNEFYKNPQTSPLRKDADSFTEHEFFAPNLNFRVEAKVTRLQNEPFFKMPTSGTMTPEYRKFAYLDFEIKGKAYRLTVLQNKKNMSSPIYRNHLFLPFQDHTNGEQTYGGGRYIDLRIPQEDTMILDFNQAYHPYCAYTDGYNCPIPPLENRLNLTIEAGIILNEEYRH